MPLVFEDMVKICSDEHVLRDFLLQNKILNLTLTPNPNPNPEPNPNR